MHNLSCLLNLLLSNLYHTCFQQVFFICNVEKATSFVHRLSILQLFAGYCRDDQEDGRHLDQRSRYHDGLLPCSHHRLICIESQHHLNCCTFLRNVALPVAATYSQALVLECIRCCRSHENHRCSHLASCRLCSDTDHDQHGTFPKLFGYFEVIACVAYPERSREH